MAKDSIVMSIRPKYVEKILGGSKTVELRRVRPKKIDKGALVLIYASSPTKSLVGAFKVDAILEASISELWDQVKNHAGISYEDYLNYYRGSSIGVGIFFTDIWVFQEPIPLNHLQQQSDFLPPQSFRYANTLELVSPQIAKSFDLSLT